MPLITFNERLLELTEAPGPAIGSTEKLKEAVEEFATSAEPYRRVEIASGFDWKSVFTVLPTGGGAVRNRRGDYLLIRRLGWWDLPKGKLDPGESLEQCALREVREETGVEDLALVRPLIVTYHSYEESGMRILKENHWYEMETAFTGPLKAQEEEDITECIWADEAAVKARWNQMYRAVQDVLRAALSA